MVTESRGVVCVVFVLWFGLFFLLAVFACFVAVGFVLLFFFGLFSTFLRDHTQVAIYWRRGDSSEKGH